jgi:FtsH-binding integral membrane protein
MSRGYSESLVFQSLMEKVFAWMGAGLAITGLMGWYLASRPDLMAQIFASQMNFWLIFLAQLGLVFYLSSRASHLSPTVAAALFSVYAALNGVTMGLVFTLYELGSVALTFGVTAGTFGTMALFGYTTKRDLSRWGSILFMALIGLIIASVANWWLGSSTLELITSAAGVLIFTGLTAYDVQKIKRMQQDSPYEADRFAIQGALILYLDFINLFLYLLRFMGRRR